MGLIPLQRLFSPQADNPFKAASGMIFMIFNPLADHSANAQCASGLHD
jgi:hypothetical protein